MEQTRTFLDLFTYRNKEQTPDGILYYHCRFLKSVGKYPAGTEAQCLYMNLTIHFWLDGDDDDEVVLDI